MSIEMFVNKVAYDDSNASPVVVLSDLSKTISVPIYIGLMEAFAIAVRLDGFQVGRPLTHDLLVSMLEELKVQILAAEIVALKDAVYYAQIRMRGAQGEHCLDCRPSDAVALAIRAKIPIYVDENVLDETNTVTSLESLSNFWQTFTEMSESSQEE